MPPKRPLEDSTGLSSKDYKKAKTRQARKIDVQAPKQTGGDSAGPSRSVKFTADSSKGLPMTLDVEKFAEARSFEIGAMQKAMQTARDDASKRVWQTLPRHLRRRTASHDPRRVPVRLREKALSEMDPVRRKKQIKALKKRGKTFDIGRTEQLLKRQQDKTWLETHIWHAKRMKMENMWGYRLAIHPTEKAYRPSHRASVHSAIIQDVSYYGVLEIKGPLKVLSKVLGKCCDPQTSVTSTSYTCGGRACETILYRPDAYPIGLVSPCTVLWKPALSNSGAKAASTSKGLDPDDEVRVLWLHIHPAVFLEVHGMIRDVAEDILSSHFPDAEIEIMDLRDAIKAFEIMGPKSSQVLSGALRLTKDTGAGKEAWKALSGLSSPSSIPRGMIIGLQVHDPRLSFPPSNTKLPAYDSNTAPFSVAPSPSVASSQLWDDDARQKPKFTKLQLDARRSKNLVPGTRLMPTQADDRIPLIVVQRSIAPSAPTSGTTPLHGYLLLFPEGWSMPFFSSLTHSGTRVGGLREHGTQRFEAGTPHFPQDYIGTRPYAEHWDARSEEEKSKWERTPTAKRVPFDKLPPAGKKERVVWQPDWDGVLGSQDGNIDVIGTGAHLIPTQPNDEMDDLLEALIREDDLDPEGAPHNLAQHVEPEGEHLPSLPRSPWILQGHSTLDVLRSLAQQPSASLGDELLLGHLNGLRSKRGMNLLPQAQASELSSSALIVVCIRMCGRGVPGDVSVIYAASGPATDEARWRGRMTTMVAKTSLEHGEEMEEEADETPQRSEIIGYVTTGHFCLQQGKGFAIGAVSLRGVVDLMRRDLECKRPKNLSNLVWVREKSSSKCRLAWLHINSL